MKSRRKWQAFALIATSLLQRDLLPSGEGFFTVQQQKDPYIRDMSLYLEPGNLPEDESRG